MVFSRNRSDGARFMRLPALLILASSVLLLAWRGAGLMTLPDTPAYTPEEAALSAILDPVAGPGRFAVSMTSNSEGGRTVLILLDSEAATALDTIRRLVPLSGRLDLAGNDRLVIEQIDFATGLPGRPGPAGWLELGLLATICLLAGTVALGIGRPADKSGFAAGTAALIPREDTERVQPANDDRSIPEAVHLARRDPAMAAAIVRRWMQTGQERT